LKLEVDAGKVSGPNPFGEDCDLAVQDRDGCRDEGGDHGGGPGGPVRQDRGVDVGRVVGRECGAAPAVAVDVHKAGSQAPCHGQVGLARWYAFACRGDGVTVDLDPAGHEIGVGGQQHTLGGDEHP
jgi:hypothetical protein